jgi:hypothetical protein
VGLVKDEDLEAVPRRGEHCPLTKFAGVINAVVAGGIDFDHVERAATISRKLDTTGADTARSISGALLAVQTAGQDSCRGGFPAASRPTEKIGVVNPVGGQRMAEGIGDLRLADKFGKSLWTIPAIKSVNHTWSLPGSTDEGSGVQGKGKTPRAPTRAQLPLLRFRPRGVSQVSKPNQKFFLMIRAVQATQQLSK